MGRSVRHWTPKYVYRRLLWWRWQRTHQDSPWLTPQATSLLDQLLRPSDQGIEWGTGRSTLWFGTRVKRLIAVETDPHWYQKVQRRLADAQVSSVDLRLLPGEEGGAELPPEWVGLFDELQREPHDFALIDGAYRDHCALLATAVVRPGGIVVVDNANWYLPSSSEAPNSVPPGGRPVSERWAQFAERVSDWRLIWTSQGITDTAIWIRPA